MNIHDVALVAFGHLIQKDNTFGMTEGDRDALVTKAYHYAESFLKGADDFDSSRESNAKAGPLRL